MGYWEGWGWRSAQLKAEVGDRRVGVEVLDGVWKKSRTHTHAHIQHTHTDTSIHTETRTRTQSKKKNSHNRQSCIWQDCNKFGPERTGHILRFWPSSQFSCQATFCYCFVCIYLFVLMADQSFECDIRLSISVRCYGIIILFSNLCVYFCFLYLESYNTQPVSIGEICCPFS